MKLALACLSAILAVSLAAGPLVDGFRPPSTPLVVFDPYMNIWSPTNNLYDSFPVLWDGTTKGLSAAVRVNGKTYRIMGVSPSFPQAATQTSLQVFPTTTQYKFKAGPVSVTLKFTTPAVPTDLNLMSQPITYITFTATSTDGQSHQVELYYDQSGEVAVNDPKTEITWSRGTAGPLTFLKMGTKDQKPFDPVGDRVGINWGYAYVAAVQDKSLQTYIGADVTVRGSFASSGNLPGSDDTRKPRAAQDQWPVLAARWSVKIGPDASATKHLIFAYDDIFSIKYYDTPFQALWKQQFSSAEALLKNAESQFASVMATTAKLDKAVLAQTYSAAGAQYSTIASLTWRQTIGAHKLVWNPIKNMTWLFLKEISSNGDFSTVDVLFPAIPLLLWANPALAELLLLPHLSFAANEAPIKYGLEWAPHQLGVWPVADATPQAQEQMPVEETGNLLLIAEWLAKKDKTKYTSKIYPTYQKTLDQWAGYLTSGYQSPQNTGPIDLNTERGGNDLYPNPIQLPANSQPRDCQQKCIADPNCGAWAFDSCGKVDCWLKGTDTATSPNNCRASGQIVGKLVLPDPGNQLCTDDFLGPIPHNVNLAAKGIVAIDGYADFLTAVGRGSEAARYRTIAADFANYWQKNGKDGDHYRLQFDLPNSYSLQYNLVFQRFLKIQTFPEEILNQEAAYYAKNQWNRYGSPLNSNAAKDGRAFTKLDWLSWAGALTNDTAVAQKYWTAIYNYAHETNSRVPLSDWYDTKKADQVGFQARPVVGGFFGYMLVQPNGNDQLKF